MSRFSYEAIVGSGERISGTLRSSSGQEAVRKLMERGYHPLDIKPLREDGPFGARFIFRRVSTSDLAVFTRQLSSLLKAGLPMVQALKTVSQQCASAQLTRTVEAIEESLSMDAGTLSEAMEEHPQVFDPVYRGLVRSGEESGNLVEVLQNLARYLMQSARLRGQVLGAFIYPVFLLLTGMAAIFVLMTFVIPRFEELFKSFEQELPLPTRLLIGASNFLAAWWWAILLLIALASVVMYALLRRPAVRTVVDRQLLRIPLLGPMLLRVEIARISHTLSALLNGGINILSALRATSETARNVAVRRSFEAIILGVTSGESLALMIERARLYPIMMINLIRTGEDTGELPEMLQELADIYEDEAQRAVTGAVKLLEPMLIIVMGGIVASIVAAVILPIFRANAMISH